MKFTSIDQVLDYLEHQVLPDADRKFESDLLTTDAADIDPDHIDALLQFGREQREGWRERTRQQILSMLAELREDARR